MGSDGADSSTEVAWDEVPLSELTSANVTYGVVQPGAAVPDGVPMIRVNNFSGHTLNLVDVMRISHAVERKYERTRLRADDVLITVVGSVGQVAVVPLELAGWNIARAVALVRPRSTALARWIAHFLRSPIAQHRMGIAANTTVQTTVNLKDLRAMRIPMPPEPIRRGISELLGVLDDRIDLLRQTNTTLEAIAQALFKSWFVDFDPVRAKAEGREPEAMDAATAALFPSEFEESELGLIPKGWRAATFGELLKDSIGGDWGKDQADATHNCEVAIVRGTDLPDLRACSPSRIPKRFTTLRKLEGRTLVAGDLVVVVSGGS
jgi:type I restriction enzyme S subunit